MNELRDAGVTVHDCTVSRLGGETSPLAAFRGQVLLIVNVASRCRYTPQYAALEALYRRYRDRGFAVPGFPCNRFGRQEPGSPDEIRRFCAAHFDADFPVFDRIEVNGPGAHALYRDLRTQRPGVPGTRAIKWNFTKFPVDRNGSVVRRCAPNRKPEDIDAGLPPLLGPATAEPERM